ncbi:hypothetical protein HTIA_1202 [Halorhabdus tiamatea SARL4B]|nr:hypothetical protein HTIA_1202 [Halorhabdus tiamatea SARL4B]
MQSISTTYEAGVAANLTVDVSVDDNSNFSQQLDVNTAELNAGGTDIGSFSGGTLADLTGTYENVATLGGGDTITVNANFTLGEDTGNDYQGDSVGITVTFNATQQT